MIHNNNNKTEKFTLHSEAIFKWWDYPLYIILTGLIWFAIIYFCSYWFSLGDWSYYPVSFSILTFILVVILANNQFQWFTGRAEENICDQADITALTVNNIVKDYNGDTVILRESVRDASNGLWSFTWKKRLGSGDFGYISADNLSSSKAKQKQTGQI